MKKKLLSFLFIIFVSVIGLNVSYAETHTVKYTRPVAVKRVVKPTTKKNITKAIKAINVRPIDVVNNPAYYLHKRISMTSRFSKYATIGLDYKPAFRSSEKYITFLLLRDDNAHNIPLSEMKLFLSRNMAEKLPEVKEGQSVKVIGTVFSDALGDVWVDAESLEVINNKNNSKK